MNANNQYDDPIYIGWRAVEGTGEDRQSTQWHYGRSVEGWLGAPGYEDALREQRRFVREHVRETEVIPDSARIQTRVFTAEQAQEVGW